MPSYNQIGFDQLRYLLGIAESSANGGVAWMVGGLLPPGSTAAAVDPATQAVFPMAYTLSGNLATMTAASGIEVTVTSFRCASTGPPWSGTCADASEGCGASSKGVPGDPEDEQPRSTTSASPAPFRRPMVPRCIPRAQGRARNRPPPWPDPGYLPVHTSGARDTLQAPSASPSPYARFLPPLRAKCRRLLGSGAAADDVAQEAVLRLLKSGVADRGDPRTVMAWLYRTCTRLAIDLMRERRRTGGDSLLDTVPCGIDPRGCVEARAAIATLAGTVPADELEAVVLCRVDGLPQPEAAQVLGVSERTVRRVLERFDERTATLRKEFSS